MNLTEHDKRKAEELETKAEQYMKREFPQWRHPRHGCEVRTSFTDGYNLACSEKNEEMERGFPMFTDWCANNGWCFYSGPNMWENKSKNMVHITTTELYALYKQQKQ